MNYLVFEYSRLSLFFAVRYVSSLAARREESPLYSQLIYELTVLNWIVLHWLKIIQMKQGHPTRV